MDTGICLIKPEYIVSDASKRATKEETNKRPFETNTSGEIAPQNSYSNFKKSKNRGQNKERPVFKEERSLNLCNTLINGPNCNKCKNVNCVYTHDIQEYLKNKPKDIDKVCYIYSTKGLCRRGITCRFSKSHIDQDFNNLKADFYDESKFSSIKNGISHELQIQLRKRNYDFSKTTEIVNKFENERKIKIESSEKVNEITNIDLIYEDERKTIDFYNKIILSPLTTVGNLPFRRICKEFGADITCGEMACSLPLVKGLTSEWALTKRHESEDIFGIQITGNKPQLITQAVQLLSESCSVDFIDLNIGCPIELIFNQGGGCALLRRFNALEVIVRSATSILKTIPFTVKTRAGIYANNFVAHNLVPKLEKWGASAITIHGRSKEQRYTKNANWEYIENCASQVKRIPIIGNGDILSFEDLNERKAASPHVSSFMIGRGALIKPWIFKEIKEQKSWDPTSSERLEILKKYVNYGLEHWGSDTKGVETTRRFLLEWLSFLYRYVPISLLQYPPQKINQRPQKYRGRDDLETLMSSGNCNDWIKISEMLLGQVPDGFKFLPKHKANAYT